MAFRTGASKPPDFRAVDSEEPWEKGVPAGRDAPGVFQGRGRQVLRQGGTFSISRMTLTIYHEKPI